MASVKSTCLSRCGAALRDYDCPMTDVPDDPKEFFESYLPERFKSFDATLAGKSSVGSMVFSVTDGGGEWSLLLRDGKLEVNAGADPDPILTFTIPSEDFLAVMVQGARLAEEAQEEAKASSQLMAFKALTLDAERAQLVKNVRGTVMFSITDGGQKRRLAVTPGTQTPELEKPECRLECQMSDYLELQQGRQVPMQLAMSGKIRMIGNAQVPMALGAVFN